MLTQLRQDITITSDYKVPTKYSNSDRIRQVRYIDAVCNCCGEIKNKWDFNSYKSGRIFCLKRKQNMSSNAGRITATKYTTEEKRNLTAKYGVLSGGNRLSKEDASRYGKISVDATNEKLLIKWLMKHANYNPNVDLNVQLTKYITKEISNKYGALDVELITYCKNPIIKVGIKTGRFNFIMNHGIYKYGSSLEQQMLNTLNKYNISYLTQTSKIKSPITNHWLSFDFKINNTLVEMDGSLHYFPRKSKLGKYEDEFINQIERDLIKNVYSVNNNISLLRVPYFFGSKIDKNIHFISSFTGTASSFIYLPYTLPEEMRKRYYENN